MCANQLGTRRPMSIHYADYVIQVRFLFRCSLTVMTTTVRGHHLTQRLGVLPEGAADRQPAVSDIFQPQLVDHCISVIKSERPTVGQEGRCQQAISHKLLLLGIKSLQYH